MSMHLEALSDRLGHSPVITLITTDLETIIQGTTTVTRFASHYFLAILSHAHAF